MATMVERERSVAPDRSYEQRMSALEVANDVRSKRAALKRDLKAGRQRLDELILDPPAFLETAKLCDLLLAVPKWGRVKVNRFFTMAHVSPSKTVGGLSDRQRREMVVLLRRRA